MRFLLLRRLRSWASSATASSRCSCSSLSSTRGSQNVAGREHGSFCGVVLPENGAQQQGVVLPENGTQKKKLSISSGALHLRAMPNHPREKRYRSPETIPEFFSKMQSALNVGNILRESGWSSEAEQRIEQLKVAWTPLVVTQVLRQPLEKETAWAFFQWLKSVRGYRHTQHTYNTMVEVFGRARDVRGIQEVLDDMAAYGCGMNVVVFSTVIHCYYKADDLDKALDVWNQMIRVGCQPNTITYTMLMTMLASVKQFDKVGEMFRDMLRAGLTPNVRTYQVLIKCLASAGHMDAALELFHKLPDLKASPTVSTFRVIMESAASTGDLELLASLLQQLKETGARPDNKLYFTIMDSLKKAGKLEEGGTLLKDLKDMLAESEQAKPEVKQEQRAQQTFRMQQQQPQEGKQLHDNETVPLQDMEVMEGLDKPLVDMKSFSTILLKWGPDTVAALEASNFRWNPWKVLRVLMGLKDPWVALQFFYWLEKQPGYKHDRFVYTKMIGILSHGSHLRYIDDLLQKMKDQGVQVNVVTMNSLIDMFVTKNKAWHALKMYYWMQEMKVKPNSSTYTILMDMLVKSSHKDKVVSIYRDMLKAGCRPDTHTYTALIQHLGANGQVDSAMQVFEKMHEFGCKPSVITYNSLMRSFLAIGMAPRALALLKRMQEVDKIQPNWTTLNVLSRGMDRGYMRDELPDIEKLMLGKDLWWNSQSSHQQMSIHDTILDRLLPKSREELKSG